MRLAILGPIFTGDRSNSRCGMLTLMTGSRRTDDVPVPQPGAPWHPDISYFALSYNGYERFDGDVGDFANEACDRYRSDGVLPDDVHELRCMLFFEQRRHHHFGWDPEGEELEYVRAIVDKIRAIAGDTLPGPWDVDLRDV